MSGGGERGYRAGATTASSLHGDTRDAIDYGEQHADRLKAEAAVPADVRAVRAMTALREEMAVDVAVALSTARKPGDVLWGTAPEVAAILNGPAESAKQWRRRMARLMRARDRAAAILSAVRAEFPDWTHPWAGDYGAHLAEAAELARRRTAQTLRREGDAK